MAFVSALTNLKYSFNQHVTKLRRVANLAETFIFKDELIKMDFHNDIEMTIKNYEFEFDTERNPNKQQEIIFELMREVDLTEKEYQILRAKDHLTYYITDIFEEHGVIKYTKVATGIFSGSMQLLSAKYFHEISNRFNIKYFKGVSAVFAAYGANNIYESITPILYENAESGPVRWAFREAAELIGLEVNDGDFSYDFIELSLSVYAGIRKPVLLNSPKRLAEKILGDAPGTGKLFRYIPLDHAASWKTKNTIMKLWFIGHSGYKAEMLFSGDKHK
ncbi:DUF4225 domain-containing protein [Enterobacter sp.]|uniref:DUF4225 domain-containing protein n=1 Tax=Enterobacter sp. TaxID=42895 RepID=UPI00296F0C17|nr:DUF4225 domain-containing protein [Enterobacter sp.]